MERPTKLNAESSQNADALVLPDDLVDLLADVCDEAGQFILPVEVAEDLLRFEVRKDLKEDLQKGLVVGLLVCGEVQLYLPDL